MTLPVAPQTPPPGAPGAYVDISAAQDAAIAAVVRRVMASYLNAPPTRRGSRGGVNPGIYAVATTDVSAASGLTLGQGTIQLCSRTNATLTQDGDSGLTCYNAGGAISRGTVFAVYWCDGDWSACVAPCGSGSGVYGS